MHLLFIEDNHDLSTLFRAQVRRLKGDYTVNYGHDQTNGHGSVCPRNI